MALSQRSTVELLTRDQAAASMSQYSVGGYFQVGIVTVLCYDAVITFDKEVKYFWKVPRRPVDFVYFANRYIGIFGAVAFLFWYSFAATLPLCEFAQWAQNVANWITVILIDYNLMIRVLAMYSRERMLSIFLKVLLTLEAVSKLGLVFYGVISERVTVGAFANYVSLCGIGNNPLWQLGMVDWLIPLAYGTILMILALHKAVGYWKASAGFKRFTLVKLLIQDQLLYLVVVITCSILEIVGFKLPVSNVLLSNVISNLGNPALLSPLGSRMLFNLKEVVERGQNGGTTYRTTFLNTSEMNFAEPVDPQRESEAEGAGSEERP